MLFILCVIIDYMPWCGLIWQHEKLILCIVTRYIMCHAKETFIYNRISRQLCTSMWNHCRVIIGRIISKNSIKLYNVADRSSRICVVLVCAFVVYPKLVITPIDQSLHYASAGFVPRTPCRFQAWIV